MEQAHLHDSNGAISIDGVSLTSGQRVLLKTKQQAHKMVYTL